MIGSLAGRGVKCAGQFEKDILRSGKTGHIINWGFEKIKAKTNR